MKELKLLRVVVVVVVVAGNSRKRTSERTGEAVRRSERYLAKFARTDAHTQVRTEEDTYLHCAKLKFVGNGGFPREARKVVSAGKLVSAKRRGLMHFRDMTFSGYILHITTTLICVDGLGALEQINELY